MPIIVITIITTIILILIIVTLDLTILRIIVKQLAIFTIQFIDYIFEDIYKYLKIYIIIIIIIIIVLSISSNTDTFKNKTRIISWDVQDVGSNMALV